MKKMLMPRKIHKQLNEQGFASIIIAFILIIVLALLTVGFAQLARREQKSALDKQLSAQAFYAAESGVNDTVQNLPSLRAAPPSTTTCLGGPTTVGPSANGVQYTCVLVDLTPPNILYDNVQPEEDRYITSSTTAGVGTITVNWGSADGNSTFAGNTNGGFTPASAWNAAKHPAVLQFSLTPLDTPLSLSRDNLANNTFTVYLYPVSNGAGKVAYSTVNQAGSTNGAIVSANCSPANGAKYPCKATITGVPGGTGPYLFRVVDHYDSSNVSINGLDAVLSKPLGFDGQTQIDVTGKAHEVLRRIQVRVQSKPSYNVPKDALEAQGACKHFTTDPVAGTQVVGLSQDTAGACDLP